MGNVATMANVSWQMVPLFSDETEVSVSISGVYIGWFLMGKSNRSTADIVKDWLKDCHGLLLD